MNRWSVPAFQCRRKSSESIISWFQKQWYVENSTMPTGVPDSCLDAVASAALLWEARRRAPDAHVHVQNAQHGKIFLVIVTKAHCNCMRHV